MWYFEQFQAFIQRAGPEILVRVLPPKREVVLGLKPTEVQVKLLQSLLSLLPNHNIFRDKEVRARSRQVEHIR
jgi:hypothetical protein